MVVGVPEGVRYQQAFFDQVAAQTGLEITQVAVNDEGAAISLADVDLVLGVTDEWVDANRDELASEAPDADVAVVKYGEDDACLLVDSSWYSANNIALPKKLSEVAQPQLESAVADSDPLLSPYALAALPQWQAIMEAWAEATPQSGDLVAEHSGGGGAVVGSALEPRRNPNNLGTDTRYRVLSDTCVQMEAAALILSTGEDVAEAPAQVLVDFLTSDLGQELVAKYAVAIPAEVAAGGEYGDWKRATGHDPFTSEQVVHALELWESLFAAEPSVQ